MTLILTLILTLSLSTVYPRCPKANQTLQAPSPSAFAQVWLNDGMGAFTQKAWDSGATEFSMALALGDL